MIKFCNTSASLAQGVCEKAALTNEAEILQNLILNGIQNLIQNLINLL